MSARSYSISGIVIKRMNLGETDRLVTLLTQEKGKIVCVAKGVRKLNSTKRAFLEPGNIVQAYLIRTRGLPLLIQAKLTQDAAAVKTQLAKIRQLVQILEIFDKLFVEQKVEQPTYNLVLKIRSSLIKDQSHLVRSLLLKLISHLGFPQPDRNKYDSILDYIQEIAERPMRSFDYLQVKQS